MERPARRTRNIKESEPVKNPPQKPQSAEDAIRIRAYQIYIERGAGPGHALDDWLQAEREFRSNR
jgi:DUF2934 family protein